MSTYMRAAVLGAAVLGLSVAATAARAADPDFCRDYARSAINQYRQAMSHERCRDRIHDYNVWSSDFRHHYGWCLNVSRDQAWDGRRGRDDFLDHCTHDDWDRGDHGDHDYH